jgi:mono/diheme cytochrome c family protein
MNKSFAPTLLKRDRFIPPLARTVASGIVRGLAIFGGFTRVLRALGIVAALSTGGGGLNVTAAERSDTDGNISTGRYVAETVCSACHQIERDAPVAAAGLDEDDKRTWPAPSFPALAAQYRPHPTALRLAMDRAHYPMREPRVAAEDLDAVAVYIFSLSGPPDVPR